MRDKLYAQITKTIRTYLLGVLEVLPESLLVPGNALVHVGGSVGETVGLTSLATEDAER
jgi:hypothetical protein